MSVSTRMHIAQSQVFRMGHVMNVLQMSGEELDDHLLQAARDNPLLILRRRRGAALRASTAPDQLETGVADRPNSLYDHVLRELAGLIARGGGMQRVILALVEELDPSGWLGSPLSEIAEGLGLTPDLVETALLLVQRRISPAGLFARDLKECLRLQLEEQELWDEEIARVVTHLDALAKGGPGALARAAGLDDATTAAHLARLRRLDPKPGSQFATDPTLTRAADVVVEPRGTGWTPVFRTSFETEVAVLPVAAGDCSHEMRRSLSEARALKKALDLRQSALRQIVHTMVRIQGDFFRDGPEALQPLTQATIAEQTGFHLSTVSRVLNGLLIEGPNGIVPARLLCARCSVRSRQDGPSKPKVMAGLRALLMAEKAGFALSDQRLSEELGNAGLAVSRRVVAKYRQELGVAPAAQRRMRA